MNTLKVISLLILVINFLPISSVANGDEYFVEPISSPKEILEQTKRFIIDNDIPINDYFLEGAAYSYINRWWIFSYLRHDNPTKGSFTVRISDVNPSVLEILRP